MELEIEKKLNDINLYNETNTYNYFPDIQTSTEIFNNNYRYNLKEKNSNKVSNNSLLTVLVCGLNSSASVWGNINGFFAHTKDSIYSRLTFDKDCLTYLLKFDNQYNYSLYNLTERILKNKTISKSKDLIFGDIENLKVDEIKEIDKHIILIYEPSERARSLQNDVVYTEFNYGISNILFSLKQKNNNVIPKINLVGHSRGGITCLQYILDHPDLVESFFALAVPFFGSSCAYIDSIYLNHRWSQPGGIGSDDIVNPDSYLKYFKRWNNNYKDFYQKIKVYAIGCYNSYSTLWMSLSGKTTKRFFKNNAIKNILLYKGFYRLALFVLKLKFWFLRAFRWKNQKALEKTIWKLFQRLRKVFVIDVLLTDKLINDLSNMILKEVNICKKRPRYSWLNDGLVQLSSQLGINGVLPTFTEKQLSINDLNIYSNDQRFSGFKYYLKCFTLKNCNINHTAVEMPSLGHNLETRDKEIVSYIIDNLNISKK